MKKNRIQVTIGLLSVICVVLTAQATSCEHATVTIDNQSTQALTITEWTPLVYSKIKILNTVATFLVLQPGASMPFDVEQTSSIMQQSGGEIQLYSEKDGKRQTIRLQFLFQEMVLSCVPLDMTKNKCKLNYQKEVISARKQPPKLTYVFY